MVPHFHTKKKQKNINDHAKEPIDCTPAHPSYIKAALVILVSNNIHCSLPEHRSSDPILGEKCGENMGDQTNKDLMWVGN